MNKAYKTVNVNSMEMTKHPGILRSGSIDQCVVICAYDPKEKIGYMIREFPIGCDEFDSVLTRLRVECDDLSRLVVCAVGIDTSPREKKLKELNKSIKNNLETVLQDNFETDNLCIRWLPNGTYAEVVLDTSQEGKFELHYQK